MLSSLLLYEDLVGPSLGGAHLRRVADYYANEAALHLKRARRPSSSLRGSGDRVAIGRARCRGGSSDGGLAAGPQRLTITVPYRKLLEVTHFHLFTVPVFLLILTHLFLMTGISRRAQGCGSGWAG